MLFANFGDYVQGISKKCKQSADWIRVDYVGEGGLVVSISTSARILSGNS